MQPFPGAGVGAGQRTPAAPLCTELLFVPYRNGIIKLNIYFQEYNYRTISESAATTVSAIPALLHGAAMCCKLRNVTPDAWAGLSTSGLSSPSRRCSSAGVCRVLGAAASHARGNSTDKAASTSRLAAPGSFFPSSSRSCRQCRAGD